MTAGPASARVLATIVALVLAAPAAASFPQSVDATVPAGGTVRETSSALPPSAKSATITVDPASSGGLFDTLQVTLAAKVSRRQKVLYCVGMYRTLGEAFEGTDFFGDDPSLQLLFLAACLEVALQDTTPPAPRAASAGCPLSPTVTPIRVGRSGGRYTLRFRGTPRRARRGALVVRCKRSAGGMVLRMRPRSRKRSLRSVVGSKLALGLRNPDTDRSIAVRTTFAVR